MGGTAAPPPAEDALPTTTGEPAAAAAEEPDLPPPGDRLNRLEAEIAELREQVSGAARAPCGEVVSGKLSVPFQKFFLDFVKVAVYSPRIAR